MYLFIFLKHLHQYPLSILHIVYIFYLSFIRQTFLAHRANWWLHSFSGVGFIGFFVHFFMFVVQNSGVFFLLYGSVFFRQYSRVVFCLFRVWMHVCASNLLFFMKLYASILTRITIFLNRHINIPALSATVM